MAKDKGDDRKGRASKNGARKKRGPYKTRVSASGDQNYATRELVGDRMARGLPKGGE